MLIVLQKEFLVYVCDGSCMIVCILYICFEEAEESGQGRFLLFFFFSLSSQVAPLDRYEPVLL